MSTEPAAARTSDPTDAKIAERADALDIAAVLDGDRDVYARIVARHQQAVAAHLWRFTRDHGTLEELVQETFVQGYLSLASYQAKAPLRHWLMRIGTRVGYKHWKQAAQDRQRGLHSLEIQAEPADDDAAPQALEAAEQVHWLLAQLPPRDRLVLTLMYLEERSVHETAELTGWSRTMVKVQAHRARKKMQDLLEQQAK